MKTIASLASYGLLIAGLAFSLQAADSAKVSPVDVNPVTTWEELPPLTFDEEPTLSITKNSAGEVRGPLTIPLSWFDTIQLDYLRKQLRTANIDINGTNADGETLLMQACRYGHVAAIQKLCACGADTNKPDNFGITPLVAHCQLTNQEQENIAQAAIVACLLEYNAKVNGTIITKNRWGLPTKQWPQDTPLYLMCKAGNAAIARYLIKAHADLGKDNPTSLIRLTQHGYLTDKITTLLEEAAHNFTGRRYC
ncbi:ankyrin repeat domain-containing protein [Candidatus Dependentiae bacterium]|nr:ankyrin repeat domain-containing protein [Candidatus Dependentiae bacterium]